MIRNFGKPEAHSPLTNFEPEPFGALMRVAVGLALGLPLAIAAGRLISSKLYGVTFWDPVALTLAAASLGVCAFAAAMIGASVAASISPMTALRTD